MSPIFALITVSLESFGSLYIFAILGSILSDDGLRKGMVPAFLKFQIAAGDRSCVIFSNQDGLFVVSCSLAALFQTTRMRMPHVASGGVVFCFAGRIRNTEKFTQAVKTTLHNNLKKPLWYRVP